MLFFREQTKLFELWFVYAPTMRFMQFMSNFIQWEASYNGVDVFYLPDDMLIEHLQSFCDNCLSSKEGVVKSNEKDLKNN